MNVLVYSGTSTSPSSLSHTLTTLRGVLVSNYAVQHIAIQSLAAHPWAATCSLLVIPAFTPSTSSMSSNAAEEIQKYVERGGKVLVLGANARVSRARAKLSSLTAGLGSIALSDDGILTLSDGESRLNVSVMRTTGAADGPAGEPTTLKLSDGTTVEGLLRVPEGTVDLSDAPDSDNPSILAHYDLNDGSQTAAGIKVRIGQGAVAVWNVHLEYSPKEEIAASILTKHAGFTQEQLAKAEEGRIRILRETLVDLGLTLPAQGSSVARPTPLLLTAAPWRANVVQRVLKELEVPELSTLEKGFELRDSNDTFMLHSSAHAQRMLGVKPEERYPSQDPAAWTPKDIIAFEGGELPSRNLAPRFDLQTYYAALREARKEQSCPDNYPNDGWGIGEGVLYGEVVTSTQTLLDKNMRLLSTLPTPSLALASSQLTGRGRGGNIWLSPPGCLMFSLLLRAPLSVLPGHKVVFVQYLVALAVAEACRDPAVLGEVGARVRIKWPNDIYVEMPGTGEKKKIGGILVNTSFGTGNVELVIGCGLNVLNPPPIPSLVQLLQPGAEQHPTMERTLAAIMAHFEPIWKTFVAARGSFEPFMDLYLDRWLHSDQLVTLTTVTPPRKVRIVGITPDHGLLRTIPERDGWAGGQNMDYIDLQPDGNSFDLMAGLIKTKT
ncbi:class II aaRS and biotin synthetase [Cubamyces lactineus]|nr:class II aaRS and biotin synthetase [Cubamyces lactineus]